MGIDMDRDFIAFEPILETHSAGERAFLKSILDAEKIAYFIEGEHAAPYMFNALPQRVMVRRDQADMARELLNSLERTFI